MKFKYAASLLALVVAAVLLVFLTQDWSFKHQSAPMVDLTQNSPTRAIEKLHINSKLVSNNQKSSLDDRKKLEILKEIFALKNDNDPRLDRELKSLSPQAKALMVSHYETLKVESRNERGTIVFLVGREIAVPEDVQFLAKVLAEAECLSLSSCTEAPPPSKNDHEHVDSLSEMTLVYPQMVALKSIQNYLGSPKAQKQPQLVETLKQLVEQAQLSPNPRISRLARTIISK